MPKSLLTQRLRYFLPFRYDKTIFQDKIKGCIHPKHRQKMTILNMLFDRFYYLGIDQEVMHLMHLASLLLILMMLCVLIIQIAIQ